MYLVFGPGYAPSDMQSSALCMFWFGNHLTEAERERAGGFDCFFFLLNVLRLISLRILVSLPLSTMSWL